MKDNTSLILSIIAIVGVFGIILLWITNVMEFSVVSLDSFVGVMVALLGVAVTLSIGFQISNVIDMKSQMDKIKILEHTLLQQTKENQDFICSTKSEIGQAFGLMSMFNQKLIPAFDNFHRALYAELCGTMERVCDNLNSLETLNGILISYPPLISEEEIKSIGDIEAEIRKKKEYNAIKDRYDKIMTSFYSNVKQNPTNER